MSSQFATPGFTSLAGVCATLSAAESSNLELDVAFDEALVLFASKRDTIQVTLDNLRAALLGVSPVPFLARQDPAVIALAMRVAHQVLSASDNDAGGEFLTTAGEETLQAERWRFRVVMRWQLWLVVEPWETWYSDQMIWARRRALWQPCWTRSWVCWTHRSARPRIHMWSSACSLVSLVSLWAVRSAVSDGSRTGIRVWKRGVADAVVDALVAATTGDPSQVDWTVVRTQMAIVTDAVTDCVPGGQRHQHSRMLTGALLVTHHLTVTLPEALRDVAARPASELRQFSPVKPVVLRDGPRRGSLVGQFNSVADASPSSTNAGTEQPATRTVGVPPVDGPHAPPPGGLGQAGMRAMKREPQPRVERPAAEPLGHQQGGAPAGPPKEPARPGLSLSGGRNGLNGEGVPQGTYPLSLSTLFHSGEQPDAGLLENIEADRQSLTREPSVFSDSAGPHVFQQSAMTDVLNAVADVAAGNAGVSGHQKELLSNHTRGVVGAKSVYDISLLQGGSNMVSPYTIMGLILRDGSSKTGDGLNMSLLDSADPSRAGIVSLSARPTGTSGPKRSYQFTLLRRLDGGGRAVMSPMTGPSVRNLFPVSFSQVDVTEQRLLENCRAAYREGSLSQESLEVRVRFIGKIFSTVRDMLRPFMHNVTTSDGVFRWYFQRWAAVSVFIIRCLNRPLLPYQMAVGVAAEPFDEVKPSAGPVDPFLVEGFEMYVLQMMAEEGTTIQNFIGSAADPREKSIGYPIVPALLLSLTVCGICGSAGGIVVAYDGKRVDRTLVHCEVCAPNPTMAEHDALVRAINEKQPFSAPQVPAAPAFGECLATMNPLYYSPKAAKPKPGST